MPSFSDCSAAPASMVSWQLCLQKQQQAKRLQQLSKQSTLCLQQQQQAKWLQQLSKQQHGLLVYNSA